MIHIKYLISISLFLIIFIAYGQGEESVVAQVKMEELRRIQALSYSVNDIDQRHINDGTEDDKVKEETLPPDFTIPNMSSNPPGDDIDMSQVEQLGEDDVEDDEGDEEDDDEDSNEEEEEKK